MQMTPDEYADYIADSSRYQRGQHRWQAVRDRAMKVIEEIMAEPKPDHVCHPDWQNTAICNDCGKPMKAEPQKCKHYPDWRRPGMCDLCGEYMGRDQP